MIYSETLLSDGLDHPLLVRTGLPEGEIHGLVQICHGMAEHSGRYEQLGCFLAENGYAAFCHDHRGHGHSCLAGETLGWFADHDGWEILTQDAFRLARLMREEIPHGPFILFGHSMGSMVISEMATREEGWIYDRYILCDSPAPNPMVKGGIALAKAYCAIGMDKTPNDVLYYLSIGKASRIFRKEKSRHAWLTTNKSSVQKFADDPLCGFHFTSAGFRDLFIGMARTRNSGWAVKTVCRPFLLIAGADDPIGQHGKGVLWLRDQLRTAGRKANAILYPGKRHEILNETDCDRVYDDILSFISEDI
ncbi:MAG: alpha/beta fold hydrolase [Clostridia bacterium]|nr:alpha/beta fold hydrolase [Clostridia bacterium]